MDLNAMFVFRRSAAKLDSLMMSLVVGMAPAKRSEMQEERSENPGKVLR